MQAGSYLENTIENTIPAGDSEHFPLSTAAKLFFGVKVIQIILTFESSELSQPNMIAFNIILTWVL